MIAVVGLPAYVENEAGQGDAGGLAVEVASAAVKAGARVELVGKIGDDGAGDALVLALGRRGIGHAALLRDPTHPTPVLAPVAAEDDEEGTTTQILLGDPAERPGLDAADIELALQYLADVRVIVLGDGLAVGAVAEGTAGGRAIAGGAAAAAAQGAAFGDARLVAVIGAGEAAPALPEGSTVLEAPSVDDGSFGRMVGVFAAALDAGREPREAFDTAVAAAGWEPVAE